MTRRPNQGELIPPQNVLTIVAPSPHPNDPRKKSTLVGTGLAKEGEGDLFGEVGDDSFNEEFITKLGELLASKDQLEIEVWICPNHLYMLNYNNT